MAAPMGASTTGDGAVPLAVRLHLTWFFLTPPFGAQNGGACRSFFGSVATIGERVNIGAGTITCNYDGANKHRTIIEDDAFIGSDSQLVAPVTFGKGATLGAGTTLTKDAPPDSLTVSRAKQISISGWQRPVKQKK